MKEATLFNRKHSNYPKTINAGLNTQRKIYLIHNMASKSPRKPNAAETFFGKTTFLVYIDTLIIEDIVSYLSVRNHYSFFDMDILELYNCS